VEYYFETTPYNVQLGKQLLVASDSTCTEYHKAKVKQKIGKDKIKIEFTYKVRVFRRKESLLIKVMHILFLFIAFPCWCRKYLFSKPYPSQTEEYGEGR